MTTFLKSARRLALGVLHKALWPIHFYRVKRVLHKGCQPSKSLLNSLVYHWGNVGFSADALYLELIVREALIRRDLKILECGTGLSTLLLGLVAEVRGHQIIALEHDSEWCGRVRRRLRAARIESADIIFCPLKDYGEFDWYGDKAIQQMTDGRFHIVVCDGPPGRTRGGRVGLPYVLKDAFRPGCLILVDDAHREEELDILQRWKNDFGFRVDPERSGFHFKTLVMPRK